MVEEQRGSKEAEAARRTDETSWATPVERLSVTNVPDGVANINVAGRRLVGPLQGFGQLWQKTYRIRLEGREISPAEVITEWKTHYARFWPKGSRFDAPGIAPGEVALISARSLGGVRVSTGIRVIYADDESFSFMNAAGHPAAGMITFSAARDDGGATLAQVQVLIRANDPFYDLMLPIYGQRAEDAVWIHTLGALAEHLGTTGTVTMERVVVDRRRNWSEAKNIWQNAAIRSGIYMAAAPIRWVKRLVRRR